VKNLFSCSKGKEPLFWICFPFAHDRRSFGLRQFFAACNRPLVLSLLVAVFGFVSAAGASDLPGEKLSTEISTTIMSPYCPGRTLSACPSTKALELRKKIKSRALKGEGKEQILAWLQQTYGESVLAAPRAGIAKVLAWTVPFIFVLLGLLLSLLKAKSLRASKGSEIKVVGPENRNQSSVVEQQFIDREIAQRLKQE